MRWERIRSCALAACVALIAGCRNASIHDELRSRQPVPSGGIEQVAVALEEPAASAEAPPDAAGATRPLGSSDHARESGIGSDAARPPSDPRAATDVAPVLGARGPRGRDDPSSRTPAIRGFAPADEDAPAAAAGRPARRATRPAKRAAETGVPQVLGIPWWALAAALVLGCVLGLVVARRRSRRALLALRRRSEGGHAWRTFRARHDVR